MYVHKMYKYLTHKQANDGKGHFSRTCTGDKYIAEKSTFVKKRL